jgi:adenylate cyclase
MHRDSPADREHGLTALTQLRDMCLHEHWTLSEVPEIEAFIAWEHARRGDLDGAIAALRAAVDDLFNAGQFAWCIPPTGMFMETLLTRGGEADLQEAQTASSGWPASGRVRTTLRRSNPPPSLTHFSAERREKIL